MKLHQLFLRTYLSIFFVVLLTLSLVTYIWAKTIYLGQIEKNLIQNIDIFSVILKNLDNSKDTKNIVRNLHKQLNLRITIIDQNGVVVAESDKDNLSDIENHINRPEIVEANKNGIGSDTRISHTVKKDLLYIAKKFEINNQIVYIRMADYVNKITDDFVRLILEIFLFITFFLIIAFLATYFISLKIKKETQSILDFLIQLTEKRTPFIEESNYTYEFQKITRLLNKVSFKLSKKAKQKAKQTAKLKIANRQKDEIISAISHEFKNPIAVISGYSETLLSDEVMPNPMKIKFLQKIHSNSHKMAHIVDKLRLTLKLEEGKQQLILSSCSLLKILESVVSDLKDKYKDREVILPTEDKILQVDETLFSMVLTNLIENALKYSEDDIEIKIDDSSVSIIDRGIGIEEDELEKINQKFYRVSQNGWNNSLGLGLFIVQSILNLHNFQLKITSEINKGSIFSIKY